MDKGAIPISRAKNISGCRIYLPQPGRQSRPWRLRVLRQQASRGSEYRTLAVALYRTAFEHEVVAVDIFAVHHPRVKEVAVDGVVELRLKLISPSVEAEVEQLMS